jgi:hypothetical protein
MPVFRRSSAGETDSKAAGGGAEQTEEAPAKNRPPTQAGKGRPTPKRSEAERNRYRSIQGGTTSGRMTSTRDPGRKLTPEEKARERDRARADRTKRMEAMRRGEDWALGPRDRGPAKKLARDYVDAHRRPMEFYMYALIVLVIALFAGRSNTALAGYMQIFLLAIIAVIAADGLLLRRSVLKVVHERLPNESTRGLAFYAIMRGLQLRRFRTPSPSLKPGDDY